jgi:hypothetical protein
VFLEDNIYSYFFLVTSEKSLFSFFKFEVLIVRDFINYFVKYVNLSVGSFDVKGQMIKREKRFFTGYKEKIK